MDVDLFLDSRGHSRARRRWSHATAAASTTIADLKGKKDRPRRRFDFALSAPLRDAAGGAQGVGRAGTQHAAAEIAAAWGRGDIGTRTFIWGSGAVQRQEDGKVLMTSGDILQEGRVQRSMD